MLLQGAQTWLECTQKEQMRKIDEQTGESLLRFARSKPGILGPSIKISLP